MTFDPSKTTEHTVPEVVDAVTEHPGLAADVLAAERARTDREPRATLIEKIEALAAAESEQGAGDGDSAPDAGSGAETQPGAGSGDGDGTQQVGPATGEPRTGIDVAPGETATLTGDGTPGQPAPWSNDWSALYARATSLDADKRDEFDRLMTDGTVWDNLPSDPALQAEFERRLVLAEAYDGSAPDDDADVSRSTPDVAAVNLTQESVMAGDPMSDANRGSQAVESAFEQPGAVVGE